MKVVFLDFDGVLNCESWMHCVTDTRRANGFPPQSAFDRDKEELDPSRVKLVSDFCIEESASIVVSSSWRKLMSMADLWDVLRSTGMDKAIQIIGVTPNSSTGFRGTEVLMWLDEHSVNCNVTKCVIFDDDGDFYSHQPLVKTTWEEGLLPAHIAQARELLNKE